jgi:hypothetical protein
MGTDGRLGFATRLLGAVSLFLVGLIHLHEYTALYSTIPTIGPLFLLSFIGGTAVALGLVLPLERLLGRIGGTAVVLLAVLGIGQAVTQFVFLAISERRPLFGFQEPGYDPTAILQARVAEVATVVLLTTFLVTRWVRSRRRAATSEADRPRRQSASR